MAELLAFYNLQEVLEEYGNEVRNKYQDALISGDKIASGNLLNSVEFLVLQDGRSIWVELHLEDYWKYVEHGRKPGKFPPMNKILEWINIKPVLPRPMENGKLPTPNQLAFLIGRKIAEEGIEPGNQLSTVLDTANMEWEQRIEDAIMKDINESVDIIFLKYFK